MYNNNTFSQNLQRYMNLKKIDRSKLCRDLDFKYSTVSDWLNAKKIPRMDKIEILANYFGINKSDLIEENNTEKSFDEKIDYEIYILTTKIIKKLSKDDKIIFLNIMKFIDKKIINEKREEKFY